jgi:Protein of unknown function (DUF1360)
MSDCTGLYLNWIEPLTTLYHVFLLSTAVAGISLFLTKSHLLNTMHDWLEGTYVGKLLDCPWCTSHWVAAFFMVIYRPLLISWGNRPAWEYNSWVNWIATPVDYLVTWLVMVTLATLVASTVYKALKSFNG